MADYIKNQIKYLEDIKSLYILKIRFSYLEEN